MCVLSILKDSARVWALTEARGQWGERAYCVCPLQGSGYCDEEIKQNKGKVIQGHVLNSFNVLQKRRRNSLKIPFICLDCAFENTTLLLD